MMELDELIALMEEAEKLIKDGKKKSKEISYIKNKIDKQNRVIYWAEILFDPEIIDEWEAFLSDDTKTAQDIDNFVMESYSHKFQEPEVAARLLGKKNA
jgi:hypothetical protein